MMSRLFNKVKPQKSFSTNASKTLIPQKRHSISIKELYKILDLDELATKFKQKAIESPVFRNRTNFYYSTIARLTDANRHSLVEDILETHKTFEEITHEGFAVKIIGLYGKAGMFDHARKMFDEMPQLNCHRTVLSLNALMNAGVKSTKFPEVYEIFAEYPSKLSISLDVVSYNTAIHAVCAMGSLSEAMGLLDEMKKNGLRPNVITYNTLLETFYKKRGFMGGEKIWALMDEDNVCRDIRSYNLTLEALVNQGELSTAVIVFDLLATEGLKPDVTSFNVFIKGYCDVGNMEEAVKWYKALVENGIVPNRITFSTLVPELCRIGECELAFDLSKKMLRRQFIVDESLLQVVVDELVKKSMIKEAEELVELGKTNNFIQYRLKLNPESNKPNNALMVIAPPDPGSVSVEQLYDILDLDELATKFKQKAIECCVFRKLNSIYDYTIARLAYSNRHFLIEDIIETHKSFEEISDEEYAVRIIGLYGKAGMFDQAHKFFNEMPQLNCKRTVMSLNALMNAGVKSMKFLEVFGIFREYPSKLSISLDVVSYNAVIHAICEMGSLSYAIGLLDEMKKNGLQPSIITYNTLLDALYKKRGLLGGERIWAMMDEDNVCRDIRSYNLTLEALINHGQLSTAVSVFDVLTSEGLKPDVTSFNIFIKGYCDVGNVEEAVKWYKALVENGVDPNRITFSTLVPELCRVRECELAFDLSKKMFRRQFAVDEDLLQLLVDELVKKSMTKEVEELTELGKTNNFIQYSLKLNPESNKPNNPSLVIASPDISSVSNGLLPSENSLKINSDDRVSTSDPNSTP